MYVVTPCNAGYKVTFDKIGVVVSYRGIVVMEGKKWTKTGLWMVPITNKASPYIANKIENVTPSVENVGVNQQVHQSTKAHFGSETHCITNAIQTSSKGELANYHHQSLGSPTTWSMLNALKITQMSC